MDKRRVDKLNQGKDGWIGLEFSELKKGDVFRMFESTGEPVVNNAHSTMWVASCDAFTGADGVWTIKLETDDL